MGLDEAVMLKKIRLVSKEETSKSKLENESQKKVSNKISLC
jgi:hypothetical protein